MDGTDSRAVASESSSDVPADGADESSAPWSGRVEIDLELGDLLGVGLGEAEPLVDPRIHFGAHQLASPASFMKAGTSVARMSVASISDRERQAEAEQLDERDAGGGEGEEGDGEQRGGGRHDATRALEADGDDAALSPVRSCSSLMRDSRKTS